MPTALSARGLRVASLDRLSSASHACFGRRRGRAGKPRTLPAREFDPDCRDDAGSSRADACGCVRQSLAQGRHSDGRRGAGVRRDHRAGFRRPPGGAVLASRLDWGEARKLLSYGGWMFATNVINPALASADQFIIGSVMGVASVAHYAVPMNLVLRSGAIPAAVGRTFFPRMSSLSGDAAYTLGARALSSMAYGFAAVCAPAIVLSPIFFRYWVSADFAPGLGARGADPFPGDVDGRAVPRRFHPPAKPGQGGPDRQTQHDRVSAVYGPFSGV